MEVSVIPCPKCSQLNTTRRTTCKVCGINLKQDFSEWREKVKCLKPDCGVLNQKDAIYCGGCGTLLVPRKHGQVNSSEMRKPLLSDYNLTDSDIEKIQSALSHNEILKNRWGSYHMIGLYIVSVASMWPWFSVASIFLGVVAMVIYVCSIGGLVVQPLEDKYFKERELRIPGASYLKEYEHQLAQYEVFKERERIKEEERKAKEEKERERKSWKYWTELSPFEFEDEMAELFRRSGYDAKVTPATGDGGVDIILLKDGKEILVQCKRHGSKVGPAPARELFGVMSARGTKEGFLVCPAGFTSGAYDFAKKHKIRLIGLKRIMKLVDEGNNSA